MARPTGKRGDNREREPSRGSAQRGASEKREPATTIGPHLGRDLTDLSLRDVLALQRVVGNRAVAEIAATSASGPPATLVVQRAPIDFKRIGRFLSYSRPKRQALLEEQSVDHLRRMTTLLEDRRGGASPAERAAIAEVLQDIPPIVEAQQQKEVRGLGRASGNWANAILYLDGKVVANQNAQKSGLAPGAKKSKWGSAGTGKKKKEIIISHNDSEATVFNTLESDVSAEMLSGARTSVELFFVSTNGACEGCKGRINAFIKEKVLPFVGRGVSVSMRYEYETPPRVANRGIPTFYGWANDVQLGNGMYRHQTVYRE